MVEKKNPEWYVGQEVVVVLSQNGAPRGAHDRTVPGIVTKVARVNVTVAYSLFGGRRQVEIAFRKDDAWENTPHARMYMQDAARIFTPEDWAENQAARLHADRIGAHRLDSLGSKWAQVSSADLQRIADLLDEVYGVPENLDKA